MVKSTMNSSMQGSKRGYVFTLNNYTPDEYDHIRALKKTKYLVVGKEVGANQQNPHLQGYVEFESKKSFSAAKKAISNRAHIEQRHGKPIEASDYCKKDGDFIETGVMVIDKKEIGIAETANWENAQQQLLTGNYNTFNDILRDPTMIRYVKGGNLSWAQKVFNAREQIYKTKSIDNIGFKWQRRVYDTIVQKDPHDRHIWWFYDPIGNTGKSQFVLFLKSKGGIRMSNKSAENAYLWNGQSPVIFDLSRTLEGQGENKSLVNYDSIEQLKNGDVISTKYEPIDKHHNVPHVFIFANFLPDYNKLSLDRWMIWTDFTDDGSGREPNVKCHKNGVPVMYWQNEFEE